MLSNTRDECINQLKAFLSRLRDANLTVNFSKSEFCQARVVFLGHIVGLHLCLPRSNLPTPSNKHELMRFLGMSECYRKFCQKFSFVAEPLTRLLQKHVPFMWLADCHVALLKIKSLLLSVPVLIAPGFAKLFKLKVDTSNLEGCCAAAGGGWY